MNEVQLTIAPNVVFDVISNIISDDATAIAKLIGKEAWAKVHELSKAHPSPVAHAFAEVTVDGVYNDALSGDVTVALDTLIRVKPVKFVPAPRAAEVLPAPTRHKVEDKAPKQTGTKGPSNAALVRELIKANPGADVAKLIELVIADKNINIPNGRVKIYVTENVVTVRGK